MNQYIKTQQLYKMSEKVAKELETIFGCDVIPTGFPASNIMEFYVFINSDGLPSTTDYRIVICNVIEHITDLAIYVNYLMACLNSKIFVEGNVNSNSIVIYDITKSSEELNIHFKRLDDAYYQGYKDLFYINENIGITTFLEKGIFIIKEKGYGTTLIDLNNSSYYIEEVA